MCPFRHMPGHARSARGMLLPVCWPVGARYRRGHTRRGAISFTCWYRDARGFHNDTRIPTVEHRDVPEHSLQLFDSRNSLAERSHASPAMGWRPATRCFWSCGQRTGTQQHNAFAGAGSTFARRWLPGDSLCWALLRRSRASCDAAPSIASSSRPRWGPSSVRSPTQRWTACLRGNGRSARGRGRFPRRSGARTCGTTCGTVSPSSCSVGTQPRISATPGCVKSCGSSRKPIRTSTRIPSIFSGRSCCRRQRHSLIPIGEDR